MLNQKPPKNKKIGAATAAVFLMFLFSNAAFASPWAEKSNYFSQAAGKFGFGFKNATLGWTTMFTEPYKPKYLEGREHTQWEGFCVGIGRGVIYTANGLIHLATFPIPVDFPDIGQGV